MNASDINTLNQVPLVQSTQILSTSAQVPMVSQVPVVNTVPVVSQVPAVAQQPIQVSSVVPAGVQNPHFITTGTGAATLVDEDYRLGRGILDDFRPGGYNSIVGSSVVVGTPLGVTTNSAVVVPNSTLVATSPAVAVSTPGLKAPVGSINDFL